MLQSICGGWKGVAAAIIEVAYDCEAALRNANSWIRYTDERAGWLEHALTIASWKWAAANARHSQESFAGYCAAPSSFAST